MIRLLALSCIAVSLVCSVQAESSMLDQLVDLLAERDLRQQDCQYKCADGSCLRKNQMCNNHRDCWDGSDEVVVRCEQAHVCEFTCGLVGDPGRQICVKSFHLCDGKQLCDSGADEKPAICAKKGTCLHPCVDRYTNELTCLKKSKICNKNIDCLDKSDEGIEACVEVNKAHRMCDFICPDPTDFTCVRGDRICDGKYDCIDKTDEDPSICYLKTPRELEVLRELIEDIED